MSGTLKVTTLQDGASSTANLTFDSNGNTTAGGTVAMASSFLRNRIINGAMQINQRNASVTSSGYTVDRFAYFGSQASKVTVTQDSSVYPVGFVNSLKVLSSSAYTVGSTEEFEIYQSIEGLNVADLAWGTANAKTVTLSFQVYSSLTGTFGGALQNSTGNRSYPFTYTISSANTWTQITITIAGDTSGTWLTNNGIGIAVYWGLGVGSTKSGTAGAWAGAYYTSATGATSVVGTSGATFYITGVQLEVGTVATPFERRLYGTELMLCQRYYQKYSAAIGLSATASSCGGGLLYPVPMRTVPTIAGTLTANSGLNGTFAITNSTAAGVCIYNSAANWTIGTGISAAFDASAEL